MEQVFIEKGRKEGSLDGAKKYRDDIFNMSTVYASRGMKCWWTGS